MLPSELNLEQFRSYPEQARKLVVAHLEALKRLPLSFLPSLLREAIAYDWKFPTERKELDKEFANISSLSANQIEDWFQGFARIRVSSQLEHLDWVSEPGNFVEQLAAYLWTTHQVDSFRVAAIAYADRLQATAPPERLPVPRLGIAVIGQGVKDNSYPLFRKLRSYGVYFTGVNSENGLQLLLQAVAARAKKHPATYGHWYIDGGEPIDHDPALTCVSYDRLETVRATLLAKMEVQIKSGGTGPEALRTSLAKMRPEDFRMSAEEDPVLNRFKLSLLTEGSGTQVFSTTFVQWATREALRRARPLTLLVRFAPRQRERAMNEMISGAGPDAEVDPVGSLIDADMGAYYNWLNQQRLPGSDLSSFLAWFEAHNEALLISPGMARGTRSSASISVSDLLGKIGENLEMQSNRL
jgi:hypothetical protein